MVLKKSLFYRVIYPKKLKIKHILTHINKKVFMLAEKLYLEATRNNDQEQKHFEKTKLFKIIQQHFLLKRIL